MKEEAATEEAASEEAVVAKESATEEATIKSAAAEVSAAAEAVAEEAPVAEEAVAEEAAKEIEKPAPAKTVSNPPDKRHIEVEDEWKSRRKKNRRKQIKRVLAGLVAMARESEACASLILAWSSPPSRLIIAEVRVCTPGSPSSLRSLRTRAHSPSPRRSASRTTSL